MRMCERVHACLSECMRADTWRSHHIVESSLPVWAVLYLSLAPSFPFYSLPLSFVLFSLPSFFPVFFFTSLCLLLSPLSLFFLFKLSLTGLQDAGFLLPRQTGEQLTKVSRMNRKRRMVILNKCGDFWIPLWIWGAVETCFGKSHYSSRLIC